MQLSERRREETLPAPRFLPTHCLLPLCPMPRGVGVLAGSGEQGRACCREPGCQVAPWLLSSPSASCLLENLFQLWRDLHFTYTLSRSGRNRQHWAGGGRDSDEPSHDHTQTTLGKEQRRKRGCLFSQLCFSYTLLLMWAVHSPYLNNGQMPEVLSGVQGVVGKGDF